MKLLAIDTSCDESCVAIFDTEKQALLSDVVLSHAKAMEQFGGVVPEMASREHLKGLPLAYEQALKLSGLTAREIEWISVTNRPGLMGALLVGVSFAKAAAFASGIPYSTVDHLEGHLFSPLLSHFDLDGPKAPDFPWLGLVVSGGHTELYLVKGILDYEWLGGTLDDAAGEAFDKIGKLLKLPYPAGPTMDRMVREKATERDRHAFVFPRPKLQDFQFSFSGLKTSVLYQVRKLSSITQETTLQIAASAQEAIIDSLVQAVEWAQAKTGVKQVVVTGGVACNSRLQSRLPEAYFPKLKHCTDNAAMIGLVTALQKRKGVLTSCGWDQGAMASL